MLYPTLFCYLANDIPRLAPTLTATLHAVAQYFDAKRSPMKSISLAALLMLVAHSSLAHEPIGVSAKTLDEYLEIIIHHPSTDPNHYVNHVTVIRGSRIILDQDYSAQTDTHSLDIQIPHPGKSPRKRIKKRAHIKVYARCNHGEEFNKEVIVH